MKDRSKAFLRQLLNTPSPSGGETAGQRVWLDYVKEFTDEVQTDAYGNAVAILNPKGTPRILVTGHSDEIAFQVQYIDDKGYISFSPVGGHDSTLPRGQRVTIHGRKGPVKGVVGALAIHMQDRSKKSEAPAFHDLFIDVGAASRKEVEKEVQVGDFITYSVGCEELRGDLWVARAHDNRIGTFIAAETLRLCSESKSKLQACVIAASTIQEEVGLHGAQMVGYAVQPDAALVVDVGHATDIPLVNKKQFGDVKLGKGPILSKGSVNHPVLIEKLEKVAERKKISYQRGIDSGRSGTDADSIFLQRGGIPTVSIGVPNRYMHTPVEVISLQDLETTSEWLAAFAQDQKSGAKFKVKI